ncbi:alpha/beta hydrolase family protein [Mucilaginibacter sp.]|uniref:alpha/beta hydrolase family protein n=1 Tax=Mucilaginibacter sp. TaxID=1882438 RepID=UPI00374CE6F4
MSKRREFLKLAGLIGLDISGGNMLPLSTFGKSAQKHVPDKFDMATEDEKDLSIIGLYGSWANGLNQNKLPTLSFRRPEFTKVESWRKAAKQRLTERMGIPEIGGLPKVTVHKQYTYDGLQIEEITWQLPYGRPTAAIVLKPVNAKEKLPAILAFHDHAANKYFGSQKITKTLDNQHPLMKYHQEQYYTGLAWANEVAKRGYVVMVPDAFAFASRRVMLQDVPAHLRNGVTDGTDNDSIAAYNEWAAGHEPILAKSLFCAGTSWPAVFFAEDKKALDILCTRPDVDTTRIGCGGLSGGGLRTTFMAGLDTRIKCCVNVGFTTTWSDFLLNKAFTHTWMVYVPMLPNELDFPEIMGLRVPLATLVLNDSEDQLYTLPEMKKAEKILTEVFTKAGAADRFKCSYYPGLHKFDGAMQTEAFDWFDRWLKA